MVLSLLIVIAFLIWHISNIFSLIRILIIQAHFIPVVLPLGFLKPAQLLCKGSHSVAQGRSRQGQLCLWVPEPCIPCIHHITQGQSMCPSHPFCTWSPQCACRNWPQPLFLTTGTEISVSWRGVLRFAPCCFLEWTFVYRFRGKMRLFGEEN